MNDPHTDKSDEILSDSNEDTAPETSDDAPSLNNDGEETQDTLDAIPLPSTSRTEAIWNNFILGAIFANFAIFMAADGGTSTPTFSNYLGVLHVAIIALVCLFRIPCVRFSKKPADWVVSIMATWAPLAMFSIGIPSENEIALLFILNIVGIIMASAVIIGMNKSFGVIPAQREIKTGGLFRIVRHPLYMSYSLCIVCIAIQTMNPYNMLVTVCVLAAIILSIKEEEAFLSDDRVYAAYQLRVRKKLIPFIW